MIDDCCDFTPAVFSRTNLPRSNSERTEWQRGASHRRPAAHALRTPDYNKLEGVFTDFFARVAVRGRPGFDFEPRSAVTFNHCNFITLQAHLQRDVPEEVSTLVKLPPRRRVRNNTPAGTEVGQVINDDQCDCQSCA